MTKEHKLTDVQKGAILALVPLYSHAKIWAQLNIPRTIITSFINRTQEHESSENLSQLRRPRKLSNTTVCYFACNAKANSRVPFKELKNLTNIDASI